MLPLSTCVPASGLLPSGDQHRVLFARRIVHRKIYKLCIPASGGSNCFDVNMVAVLSSCVHYEGDGLKVGQVNHSCHVTGCPLTQEIRV